MPKIIDIPYVITEKDPNVTLYDVSANVEGVCAEYIVPRKHAIVILPEHAFSFYAEDNGTTPTEIPDNNRMKLRVTDPSETRLHNLATIPYVLSKEFTDRDLLYKVGVSFKVTSDYKLQIVIKPEGLSAGATKLDKTKTKFALRCRLIYETLD